MALRDEGERQVRPPSCWCDCPRPRQQARRARPCRRRRCRTSPGFVILTLVALCLVPPASSLGHASAGSQPIGIEQRLGQTIPPYIVLSDEQGGEITLGALVKRPTIMALVYYSCDRFCPQLLAGLAAALPQLPLQAVKDYQVVTVSFDATDTPALARDLKRNYFMAINRPFPPDGWRFLTGDQANIEKLCTATGFSFRKEEDGFAHPVALIILSPDRRITRYLHVTKFAYGVEYPITFSPVGLSQALADASQGRLGAPTSKEFLLCFPHEPYRQQGFYTLLTWIGAATILCLVALFIYLAVTGRRPQKGKNA
jgi:protein SCO1/2